MRFSWLSRVLLTWLFYLTQNNPTASMFRLILIWKIASNPLKSFLWRNSKNSGNFIFRMWWFIVYCKTCFLSVSRLFSVYVWSLEMNPDSLIPVFSDPNVLTGHYCTFIIYKFWPDNVACNSFMLSSLQAVYHMKFLNYFVFWARKMLNKIQTLW